MPYYLSDQNLSYVDLPYRPLNYKGSTSSNVKVDEGENLLNSWHYHPELKLVLLKQTSGMRMIGTDFDSFGNNDVFFIGKNVPHIFLDENRKSAEATLPHQLPQAVVIRFSEALINTEYLDCGELRDIQQLFLLARQGIHLSNSNKEAVIPLMENMLHSTNLERTILLIEILRILTKKNTFNVLMRESSLQQLNAEKNEKIQSIIRFTTEHFDEVIPIERVAVMAQLTKESFCRFFKNRTGKTYLEFLIELRIRKSCVKLISDTDSIKEIVYSCGFTSPSNFWYHFKRIMNQSPKKYRKQYFESAQKDSLRELKPNACFGIS